MLTTMNPLEIVAVLKRLASGDLHPTMLDPFELDEINEWLSEQEERLS